MDASASSFSGPLAADPFGPLVARAADLVVGLDFDGVLAPIVEDPASARIHPDAAALIERIAARVRGVAVITGRPARQAIALGDLDALGARLVEAGSVLEVFGQYGNERWSAVERSIRSPRPPAGLATFARELPSLLRRHDAAEAHVEEKGLALAVHTRRLADPEASFARLAPALAEAATAHGLVTEPGRFVVEVRAPGTDKGDAVRAFADERRARAFVYVGDDLGDIPAFAALAELRAQGLTTLRVAASSTEQNALVEDADLVVPGPDGVMALLAGLAAALERT